jgi:predicted dehydrogenase
MKNLLRIAFTVILILTTVMLKAQTQLQKPVRIAIAGMTHDHIGFILGKKDMPYMKIVGIYEPNREIVGKYARSFHFDTTLVYNNLERMLEQVKPEAVVAFGSIYEHLAVVEACAPRGIHVMVEKPLATSMKYAGEMQDLAAKYKIYLLTDYETSWYPSTAKSWQLVNDSSFVGKLKRVVIHDGHQGPREIGCSKEFLEWLTDPVQNGGGAVVDFGCYGANLMTYLTRGQEPVSVTAVIRQLKPEVYPKVDDDATIIVSYPGCTCVIQASWNWPFGRKDMEIYGDKGYIIAQNAKEMRLKNQQTRDEVFRRVTSNDIAVSEDPFAYFAEVIRGKITMTDYDPYSLKNNIMVVRILDAARESARTGKTIVFKGSGAIKN